MYTDPFAEIQGRKPEVIQTVPSVPAFPIMPGMNDSVFPVSGDSFPVEGENTQDYSDGHVGEAVQENVYEPEPEVPQEVPQYFTEQPTELHEQPYEEEMIGTDEATAGSTTNDADVSRYYASEVAEPELEATVPDLATDWHKTRPVLPPRSPRTPPSEARLAQQGTEISAIDPIEETGLSGMSYLNRDSGETPLMTRHSLPRKESRDNWIVSDDQRFSVDEVSSVEISILGHPTAGGPATFPAKGKSSAALAPVVEFADTLVALKKDSTSQGRHAVSTVGRVISQCVELDIVRKHPINRTLFCEAIEAVSFHEGPVRDAAKEAVNLLVECLEESSLVAEGEDDRSTASAALGALWNLTFAKDEATDDGMIGLIGSTKKAMMMFPQDAEVQTNAAGLLVNLAADKHGQREVVNLGCVEALVAGVKAHPDKTILLEHACQILAMIAARKELRAQLPLKYTSAVLDIAGKHEDPSVKRWSNWLKSLTTA